jgi:flagellar hook assembly protein FlgD
VSEGEVPAGLVRARLAEVVPNPARGNVRLSYVLPRAGEARLEVFDSDGRLVRKLVTGQSAGGQQTAAWNRTDDAGLRVPAGVYVVRFSAGPDRVSRKLVLTD